ncbi:MAG: MerR family transcriptional regulator [Thermomicrobiales bacterium]
MFDRLRTEPVYNTRAVVQRTGVPADTFRAWERRYGLPAPARSAGNQRLYSEQDIAVIRWLRDQTDVGLTISQAVALYRSELTTPDTTRSDPVPAPTKHSIAPVPSDLSGGLTAYERYVQAIVAAFLEFDAAGADIVVEEAMALLPVEDVCLHVLRRALQTLGEQWHRGDGVVSVEHFASEFVLRKLQALFNLSRPDLGAGPIVACCVEGEQHEIGLLLASLFLSRRGYRIVYLGANLPMPDLIEIVRRIRPPMVLLSASTMQAAERLIATVDSLNRAFPMGANDHYAPVIGFGGRVFDNDTQARDKIGATYVGSAADEIACAVNQVAKLDSL